MRMRRAMTSCVADHFIVEFVRFIVRALQSIQPSAMASRVLSARLSAPARLAASRSSLPVRLGARRWMSSPVDPATTPKKSSGDLVWIVRCASYLSLCFLISITSFAICNSLVLPLFLHPPYAALTPRVVNLLAQRKIASMDLFSSVEENCSS
jgi:hypothetical protein